MTQKTILCYGDSNTWGYVPTKDHATPKSRYPRNQRWTGMLQEYLGKDYYVVEEGLNSRTTNVDYDVPPERNGKTYLAPCLYSHSPIDLVILALGGNDTKIYFNRSAEDIKNGLADLIDMIQTSTYGPELQAPPKILILSPAMPYAFIEDYKDEQGRLFMKGAVDKIQQLITLYAELAKQKGCYYLDISKEVKPSEVDGVHLDQLAHAKCAQMIYEAIKQIYKGE